MPTLDIFKIEKGLTVKLFILNYSMQQKITELQRKLIESMKREVRIIKVAQGGKEQKHHYTVLSE